MNILMDSITRAGKADTAAIREALYKTDYTAPNGRFQFTDKGEGYGFDVVLVQIANKEPRVVTLARTEKP